MRQLNKETYEAPLTTRRVVTMESSCMATSNEHVVYDENTKADINYQDGNTNGMIDFSSDNSWRIERN